MRYISDKTCHWWQGRSILRIVITPLRLSGPTSRRPMPRSPVPAVLCAQMPTDASFSMMLNYYWQPAAKPKFISWPKRPPDMYL